MKRLAISVALAMCLAMPAAPKGDRVDDAQQPPAEALLAQFLGLSESQTGQFQQHRQAFQQAIAGMTQEMAPRRQRLEQLLNSESPNPAEVGAAMLEVRALERQAAATIQRYHEVFLELLTEEQKQKAAMIVQASSFFRWSERLPNYNSLSHPIDAPDAPADFERRLRETHGIVYRIAYSVLGNAADAEEVTQDVFLRAYRKYSALRDAERFRAWVGRISWRLALNRRRATLRSMRRDTAWLSAHSAAQNPETEAAGREMEQRLREEIDRLPAKLREALLLSAVEGLDSRGVAEILDIPEGTVRSRLHLARRQLLKTLWK